MARALVSVSEGLGQVYDDLGRPDETHAVFSRSGLAESVVTVHEVTAALPVTAHVPTRRAPRTAGERAIDALARARPSGPLLIEVYDELRQVITQHREERRRAHPRGVSVALADPWGADTDNVIRRGGTPACESAERVLAHACGLVRDRRRGIRGPRVSWRPGRSYRPRVRVDQETGVAGPGGSA